MPEPTPAAADGSRPCPDADPASAPPPDITISAEDPRMRLVSRHVMPQLPAILSSRGAQGEAVVSFVIDTLGRVDPRSGLILSSTAWAWSVAICRALPRMRYEPVRANGVLVRARLTQAYRYYTDP
jgi:hypothetical protein